MVLWPEKLALISSGSRGQIVCELFSALIVYGEWRKSRDCMTSWWWTSDSAKVLGIEL